MRCNTKSPILPKPPASSPIKNKGGKTRGNDCEKGQSITRICWCSSNICHFKCFQIPRFGTEENSPVECGTPGNIRCFTVSDALGEDLAYKSGWSNGDKSRHNFGMISYEIPWIAILWHGLIRCSGYVHQAIFISVCNTEDAFLIITITYILVNGATFPLTTTVL